MGIIYSRIILTIECIVKPMIINKQHINNFINWLFKQIINNKIISLFISFYVVTMILIINWGIPNPSHPFPYHMDEWHQLQAIKGVFKYGTPNIEGAANGTLFHFFLSGIYLTPFVVFKIVHPFSIGSAVDNLGLQQGLFQILRFNTLIFGILSIIFIGKITKSFFKANPIFSTFLFIFTPIFLSLSNYFKYDIALIFWIILSTYTILLYGEKQSNKLYFIAGIISALAISTKISALPMVIIYFFSFFLFTNNLKRNLGRLFIGLLIFVSTFLIFGIPDLLLGKGNLFGDFFYNILVLPNTTNNLILPKPYLEFMTLILFPSLFGKALTILFVISLIYVFVLLVFYKKIIGKKLYKNLIFISFSLVMFLGSIVPLKYYAGSNRALVLLPFFAILISIFLSKLISKSKIIVFFIVIVFFVFQFLESFSWVSMKLLPGPEKIASEWIVKNIPPKTLIGLENAPLYQLYPDLILKEFYFKQYSKDYDYRYSYSIINATSKNIPEYVVITNDKSVVKYVNNSSKKDLIKRLNKDYRRIVSFSPDFRFYNFFGDSMRYYFSTLVASPTEISIYKRVF